MKKFILLVSLIVSFLIFIGVIIPLVHDFIFDNVSIHNYYVKSGIVKDVRLKKDKDVGICEHIYVDDYDIFVQCGEDYKQQFNVGDKTKYFVYKGKGYHTEAQMKSGSVIGKILDYGMILIYALIVILIGHYHIKIEGFIDKLLAK